MLQRSHIGTRSLRCEARVHLMCLAESMAVALHVTILCRRRYTLAVTADVCRVCDDLCEARRVIILLHYRPVRDC